MGRQTRNKVTHFLGGACSGLQPHSWTVEEDEWIEACEWCMRRRARVDAKEEKAGGGGVGYPGVEHSTDQYVCHMSSAHKAA